MRVLYHTWFCPFSRKIRVALLEKGLDYEMRVEKTWERRTEFLLMNPAGTLPVLLEEDGTIVADSYPIGEYLEEVYPDNPLFGLAPVDKAEVRRLLHWFDVKFNQEVTQYLVSEKVMKRFLGMGQPDSNAIRCAAHNIRTHLDYIGHLADRRDWLAGRNFSMADIAAAAHISVADYLGSVPWEANETARTWYMRIKSRPSVQPLLKDFIAGLRPPDHYAKLDF
jgi:glutathione S-transferase